MTGAPPARLPHRPHIAGLRAVAVGLVVGFHAGVPWLPGGYVGVDVFFVISGFLMTSLLAREITTTGRLALGAFLARRIRRLLPAAVLVLITTVAVTTLVLPPLVLPDIAAAAVATALYGANVRLASIGTDYLANQDIAPLQHYWSLGVEEQFYLGWPLLLLAAFWLSRRRRVPVGATVATVCAGSFALCALLTPVSAPWAFFSLPTRAWELGAGGLLALAAPRLARLPDRVAAVLGWAGLAALVGTAATYTESTLFPGWAATLPVAATAAILVGGAARGGVATVLRPAPVQHGGALSYSLYLWHWPILVLPAAVLGELGAWARAGLVGVAFVLAQATYVLVERPVQRSPRVAGLRPAYGMGVAVTAAAVAAGLLVGVPRQLHTDDTVAPLTEVQAAAGAPVPAPQVPANLTPALDQVVDDVATIYGGCHGDFFAESPGTCVFGQPEASRSVVLIGDSHAAQWFPALQQTAVEDGWRLTVLTEAACPAADLPVLSDRLKRRYVECERWRAAAVARIQAERPDVVVIGDYSASYRALMVDSGDFVPAWSDGLGRVIGQFPAATRTIVLGDTPSWPTAPANCLSAHLRDPAACSTRLARLVDGDVAAAEADAAVRAGARFVPTTPWMCTDRCAALADNVVVYRDRSHITATFSALLEDRLAAVLDGSR